MQENNIPKDIFWNWKLKIPGHVISSPTSRFISVQLCPSDNRQFRTPHTAKIFDSDKQSPFSFHSSKKNFSRRPFYRNFMKCRFVLIVPDILNLSPSIPHPWQFEGTHDPFLVYDQSIEACSNIVAITGRSFFHGCSIKAMTHMLIDKETNPFPFIREKATPAVLHIPVKCWSRVAFRDVSKRNYVLFFSFRDLIYAVAYV